MIAFPSMGAQAGWGCLCRCNGVSPCLKLLIVALPTSPQYEESQKGSCSHQMYVHHMYISAHFTAHVNLQGIPAYPFSTVQTISHSTLILTRASSEAYCWSGMRGSKIHMCSFQLSGFSPQLVNKLWTSTS